MRSTATIVSTLIAILSCASITARAQTPNASVVVPRISCPRIDGDLSDLAWTEASQLNAKLVMDVEAHGSSRVKCPRIVYFGYDDVAFYFAFIDFSPDPTKLASNPAKGFWQGDSIEIYLQWDRKDPKAYIQFGFTPKGETLALPADEKPRPADGYQVATSRDGIRWCTEVAIPWKYLGVAPPKSGDAWGFNFCGRQVTFKSNTTGNMSWNPCYGAFGNSTRFGTATFGD
jgi:hypothetical protein